MVAGECRATTPIDCLKRPRSIGHLGDRQIQVQGIQLLTRNQNSDTLSMNDYCAWTTLDSGEVPVPKGCHILMGTAKRCAKTLVSAARTRRTTLLSFAVLAALKRSGQQGAESKRLVCLLPAHRSDWPCMARHRHQGTGLWGRSTWLQHRWEVYDGVRMGEIRPQAISPDVSVVCFCSLARRIGLRRSSTA